MATKAVKWWLLIVLLPLNVHHKRDVSAELIVIPVDTNATVGSQVRLSCSSNARREVNWQFGEELNAAIDIYIAGEGLGRQYRNSIRHKVDINTEIGQYDLVISNVTHEDDGFYICSEPGMWGSPPHARLTITGGELPAKVCRENIIAIKGGDIGIIFSACSPEPYYLSHVPVGLSHSNDVYNLGKLINSYAESGRFAVVKASEGVTLKVKNILLSDAGTFSCRGDSGHGEWHNKELVVLDEMPTCTDNISHSECMNTTAWMTEVSCAVNYTGNCAPNSIWRYEYGDKSSSKVQQEFTCFNQTYSRVESRTFIKIKLGSWLVCHVEDTTDDAVQKFLCNTSIVPDNCNYHELDGTSSSPTANSSKTMLITLIVLASLIAAVVIAVVVAVVVCRRSRNGKSNAKVDDSMIALPQSDWPYYGDKSKTISSEQIRICPRLLPAGYSSDRWRLVCRYKCDVHDSRLMLAIDEKKLHFLSSEK